MSRARVTFHVSRADEGNSLIPTLGAPTTALDAYRTIAVAESNLDQYSVAFTDVNAAAALEKIATGPITSIQDLEAAETALTALLLYDEVNVFTWGPKADFRNGLVSRARTDTGKRSQVAHEIFALAQSHDWLIAPECAEVDGDKVVGGALRDSPLLSYPTDRLSSLEDHYWSDGIAYAVLGSILALNAPTYVSDQRLTRAYGKDNFQKRFYHRMRISWNKHTAQVPSLDLDFLFPPLLAVALDRMGNRQDLKAVVAELREETAAARAELFDLNRQVADAIEQRDAEAICVRVEEAFSAIVPESRLSEAHRKRRSLARVFGIAKPILNFFAAQQSGRGLSMDELSSLSIEAEQALFAREKIVDRTVTSKTFAGLLETWNVNASVRRLFSEAEIAAINRTMPTQ